MQPICTNLDMFDRVTMCPWSRMKYAVSFDCVERFVSRTQLSVVGLVREELRARRRAEELPDLYLLWLREVKLAAT